jgi:hypothetical protein
MTDTKQALEALEKISGYYRPDSDDNEFQKLIETIEAALQPKPSVDVGAFDNDEAQEALDLLNGILASWNAEGNDTPWQKYDGKEWPFSKPTHWQPYNKPQPPKSEDE